MRGEGGEPRRRRRLGGLRRLLATYFRHLDGLRSSFEIHHRILHRVAFPNGLLQISPVDKYISPISRRDEAVLFFIDEPPTHTALAAARRLLDLGVAASSIKIACENDQLEPLGDQVIDRVVAQSLDVAVEYGLKFAELVRDGGALSAARFARPVQPDDAPAPAPPAEDDVEAWVERPATPPPEVVDLPCGLVVGASTPAVAADAAALTDYPLTVDSTFKTCDDSIYAAGRHVAGQERFNSLELGACLAQSLLARLTDSSVEAPDFRKARAVNFEELEWKRREVQRACVKLKEVVKSERTKYLLERLRAGADRTRAPVL